MAKTLYVGNLPWGITEEELTQAFSEHASIESVRIIKDRETGRSKGFGFVEVEDDNVEDIVAKMNGTEFGGRTLVVNEAKERQAR
jgi:RNA recognition motif-containing protein